MSEPSAVGRWFYVHEGRRHGPVELSRLVDLILAQELPEDCLIWRAGMPEWVRAHELEEIKRELPPPVPMSAAMPTPSPPEPHEDEEGEEGDEEPFEEEDFTEPEPPPSEPAAAAPGAPASEVPAAALAPGEAPASARHHRHRHRHRRPMVARQTFLRRWLVPLVIVLLSLMIGLWWLLVRMNEVPSGRVIIREGALRPLDLLAGPPVGARQRTVPGLLMRCCPSRVSVARIAHPSGVDNPQLGDSA